jgi:hypothetical protein
MHSFNVFYLSDGKDRIEVANPPEKAALLWLVQQESALPDFLDCLFQVANLFLDLAFDLIFQTLGLLLLVTRQLPDFFLNLPAQVLCGAFDLIFVHDCFLIGKCF